MKCGVVTQLFLVNTTVYVKCQRTLQECLPTYSSTTYSTTQAVSQHKHHGIIDIPFGNIGKIDV